jgi:hypothetical protein
MPHLTRVPSRSDLSEMHDNARCLRVWLLVGQGRRQKLVYENRG